MDLITVVDMDLITVVGMDLITVVDMDLITVVDMDLITVVGMDLVMNKVQIMILDLLAQKVGRIGALEIIQKILSLKILESEEKEEDQVLQSKKKIFKIEDQLSTLSSSKA